MKTLTFDDYDMLVGRIIDDYERLKEYDELHSLSVIAKYDEVKIIVEILIRNDFDIKHIELFDMEFNNYDKEYVVTIFEDEIYCSPLYEDGKYLRTESEIMYVMDNCSSKVLSYCGYDFAYEVSVEEDFEECDCENCDCQDKCECCDECYDEYDEESDEDDMHGFTVSKSDENGFRACSFYSSEYMDEDMTLKILEKLNF